MPVTTSKGKPLITLKDLTSVLAPWVHVWYWESNYTDERAKLLTERDYFKYKNYKVTHMAPIQNERIDPGYTILLVTIRPAE